VGALADHARLMFDRLKGTDAGRSSEYPSRDQALREAAVLPCRYLRFWVERATQNL